MWKYKNFLALRAQPPYLGSQNNGPGPPWLFVTIYLILFFAHVCTMYTALISNIRIISAFLSAKWITSNWAIYGHVEGVYAAIPGYSLGKLL